MNKKVLVTGSAGFIGMHLVMELVTKDYEVFGIDSINDYYDVSLKHSRLQNCGIELEDISEFDFVQSSKFSNFHFLKFNLIQQDMVEKVFSKYNFEIVVHLAAQAGVRYSIENPRTYIDNNITSYFNILDACRRYEVKKFIYASSSSVYGNSKDAPFDESMNVDKPVSLYAATKKANELIAHSFSEIYGITTVGLRFFTVYGPWGRPDMAYFSFTKAILEGQKIKIFNKGELSRDFTYIDDIVNGIVKLINVKLASKYSIFNIGNDSPEKLINFVEIIENATGKIAVKEYVEMQKGDVLRTWAKIDSLNQITGYKPKVQLNEGISNFVNWFRNYYKK